MKAIENVGIFNGGGYHTRFLKLEFSQPLCFFYEEKDDDRCQRSHKLVDLFDCHVIDDVDIWQRIAQRDEKRSSSWLRRQLTSTIQRCPWNFPFILSFKEKEYELYAASRADRDKIVQVLAAIGQMNAQGIEANKHLTPMEWLEE